ncbi:LysR family transcriptional regulator [Amantichitinum ursilacus]|uniref:HTH-type transcriptional regulator GbpR n=1 Tax=Amantichitinum ursilacus TaxID=857265 RepID=A0A0N1JSW5_9NEIS|nr:LysR family transcriptional regulator [Amantichitinum ursilacus]KPC53198.1 HTH-type transcriptional regulator GbpR [Amantichitinum ursilacus]
MLKPYLYQSLLHRLRYKHLYLLVALDEHGNLHQAAETLAMSQPAASRMLREVEQYLDCPLFERLARGMKPTEVGIEVIRFARATLGGLERCADNLTQWQRGGFGQLIVGTIMGAAPDWIAQAVSDLKVRKPLLKIRIKGETSDQLIELLEQGRIDFAIGRFSDLEQHNWLDFEALGNEKLLLVVRSGHALAREESVTLAQLATWPWVLQPMTSPARQLLEHEFEAAQVSAPQNTVECDSIFATLQLAQRSDAVTILSEPVLRDHLQAGLLVTLPLAVGRSLAPFGVLTRKGEEVSHSGVEFLDILRRMSRVARVAA